MPGQAGKRLGVAWALVVLGTVADAATINVPADQPTIAAAIQVAMTGDTVLVQESSFNSEYLIDWLGKAITVRSVNSAQQPEGGLYRLSPGGTLMAGYTSLRDVNIVGELRSGTSGAADVISRSFNCYLSGRVTVLPGAQLSIHAQQYMDISGYAVVQERGVLSLVGGSNGVVQTRNVALSEDSQLVASPELASLGSLTGTDAAVRLNRATCESGARWRLSGGSLEIAEGFENQGDIVAHEVEAALGAWSVNWGTLQFFDAFVMASDIANQGGELGLYGTTLVGTSLVNYGSHVTGDGFWATDLTNQAWVDILHDTTIVGDVQNDGAIVVHDGTLTIVGTLSGNGTISGQYAGRSGWIELDQPRTAPVGLRVDGAIVVGPSGGLSMPGPLAEVRVSGNFDLAVNDQTRFDLAQATLLVGVLSGSATSLEVMSADLGPDPAGLDRQRPGHYPIGTLHVAASVVNLVDQHPNQLPGMECTEAVYVHTLHIGPGAALNTNGYRVYYETLVNEGTIDEPQNVQPFAQICRGDCNCDHTVGFADIDLFVASLPDNWEAWRSRFSEYYGRSPDCPFSNADTNGDGHVGFGDIDGFVGLIPSACE